MYLNNDEDEKTQDPFTYDERFQNVLQKIFEQRSEEITKVFTSQFINHVLDSINLSGQINMRQSGPQTFHFYGFPDCDYFKLIAIVLTLWNKRAGFPMSFISIDGFTDETAFYSNQLNQNTPLVHDIFQHLSNNNFVMLEKELKDLLILLGPRGFMTMLGFRKTVGSQDLPWPSKLQLIQSFNRPHITLTDEEQKRVKNASKLTVGARAWCKHAHRSSEGFWGLAKGTEIEKNEAAEVVAKSIIDECIWINAHILPHNEYIIECRNERGYGIRWTIKGEFRGFLEPQMEGGHDKKWRH